MSGMRVAEVPPRASARYLSHTPPSSDDAATCRPCSIATRRPDVSRALRSDLWLIPLLCVVASVVLAVGTLAIDRYFEYALVPQSLVGSPAAAQTVLSTIASSMVTLASLMLSLTLVAVQLAKGQFSRASCARCSATVAGRRDELERAVRLPRRFDKRVHRSVYSPSAGTVHLRGDRAPARARPGPGRGLRPCARSHDRRGRA